MGLAIETVHAFVSAAAVTTEQLLAAGTQQTLAVRATNGSATAILDSVWANTVTPAALSIRSPRLHDNTKGILLECNDTTQAPLVDEFFDQVLYSQDSLTLGLTFPAAPGAGVLESIAYNVYYNDLPGIAGNFRTWAAVQPNIIEYVGVQTSPTSAATNGSWGNGVAINSTFDLLKANQLYAVLGYQVSAPVTAVALQGPDIGNLLVGGPGSTLPIETRSWFARQSVANNRAYIPVINSANKSSTLANVCSGTAATQYTVTWNLARLAA